MPGQSPPVPRRREGPGSAGSDAAWPSRACDASGEGPTVEGRRNTSRGAEGGLPRRINRRPGLLPSRPTPSLLSPPAGRAEWGGAGGGDALGLAAAEVGARRLAGPRARRARERGLRRTPARGAPRRPGAFSVPTLWAGPSLDSAPRCRGATEGLQPARGARRVRRVRVGGVPRERAEAGRAPRALTRERRPGTRRGPSPEDRPGGAQRRVHGTRTQVGGLGAIVLSAGDAGWDGLAPVGRPRGAGSAGPQRGPGTPKRAPPRLPLSFRGLGPPRGGSSGPRRPGDWKRPRVAEGRVSGPPLTRLKNLRI